MAVLNTDILSRRWSTCATGSARPDRRPGDRDRTDPVLGGGRDRADDQPAHGGIRAAGRPGRRLGADRGDARRARPRRPAFFDAAIKGLGGAGIDVRDPAQLLLVLKRLGSTRCEELFGAGDPDPEFPRGRRPILRNRPGQEHDGRA